VVTFDSEWARCATFIAPALEHCHGNYELADVRELCLAGQMQLWPGEHCAVVTEIHRYPRRTGCNVIFGGGDLEELATLQPRIEAWAKAKGCDHITVVGRKGWVRALGQGEIVASISRKEL
jgi:hypothetical protein